MNVNRPQLVGMVHLPALPGSPAWDGTPIAAIADMALADVLVLERAGFDAALIQNSLDRPTRERVDQLAVALMSAIVTRVRLGCPLTVGVNIVKNDGPAAVAIAAAAGAEFVRVKALTGMRVSAEGIMTGCAYETATMRMNSGARPAIWADVREPTSWTPSEADFASDVADTLELGGADAIVITARDAKDTFAMASAARDVRPDAHLVIGGRVDSGNVLEALSWADTVIIGSALKAEPGIRGRNDFAAAHAIAKSAGRLDLEHAAI